MYLKGLMAYSDRRIKITYDLTVDGKLIHSFNMNKPFRYVQGKKDILPGLQKAIKGLKPGQRKAIQLSPKQGYGIRNPQSVMEMSKTRFPKRDHFIGKEIRSQRDGKFLATVREVRKETLVLDFNHPLAGKTLHYDVRVLSIKDPSF